MCILWIIFYKGGDFLRTEYLLDKEVEHVLAALTPSNQLVCRVILHTGLRVGDVLRLKTDEIAPIFYVTEQKTGKKKRVGLPRDLLKRLRKIAGKYYVFEHRLDPKRHRTRQAVWADVKRAAKAFRLNQNVAPHSFRKVYAVELFENYGDLKKVQRALNHSNETVTLIYAMAAKALEAKQLAKLARKGKHYV